MPPLIQGVLYRIWVFPAYRMVLVQFLGEINRGMIPTEVRRTSIMSYTTGVSMYYLCLGLEGVTSDSTVIYPEVSKC